MKLEQAKEIWKHPKMHRLTRYSTSRTKNLTYNQPDRSNKRSGIYNQSQSIWSWVRHKSWAHSIGLYRWHSRDRGWTGAGRAGALRACQVPDSAHKTAQRAWEWAIKSGQNKDIMRWLIRERSKIRLIRRFGSSCYWSGELKNWAWSKNKIKICKSAFTAYKKTSRQIN